MGTLQLRRAGCENVCKALALCTYTPQRVENVVDCTGVAREFYVEVVHDNLLFEEDY